MLKISNLHVSVGKKKILKGVDLEIKPGEIEVVMGPNGSGKSTLANVLMGHTLYTIDNGQLAIDDENLNDMKINERAKAGLFLVFQSPESIEGVSVEQILRKVGKGQGLGVVELRKALESQALEVGLKKEMVTRSLNLGFSGGEKKRMEMLQMERMKPKYVIVDEVDSGLDIDGVKIIAKCIEQRAKSGTGILLITHYPRMLKYLKVKSVNIMVRGKIVARGGRKLLSKLERSGYEQFII